MIGKVTFVWLGLAAVATGVLFHTSYRVQELEAELGALNREIIEEQEAIRVLKAEWSYLNEPARLERLSREYLLLQPTQGDQIADIDSIPEKLPTTEDGPAVASRSFPMPGRKPVPAAPVVPTAPDGVLMANFGVEG